MDSSSGSLLFTLIISALVAVCLSARDVNPVDDRNETARCVCGVPNRHRVRIVGGSETDIQKYPWMVGIKMYGFVACSGALISDRYVLTAAHCLRYIKSVSELAISLGATSRERNYLTVKIDRMYGHTNYSKKRPGFYDIAILRLQQPIHFDINISPICLPSSHQDFSGEDAIVAGWGLESKGGTLSQNLHELEVKVFSYETCNPIFRSLNRTISKSNICAGGEKGKDACQGDSGSPLFVQQNGTFYVAGVVSWGIGCGEPGIPGVYTNVISYLDWIHKYIQPSTSCSPPPDTVFVNS